jgi:hypothetical protein
VVSSLPSPPPCLRLDQQNLPLLNEEHHPAAAAATTTAVNCVVTALVRFMSKELPPPLSVLLAAGALPYPHFNSSFLNHKKLVFPQRPLTSCCAVRAEVEKKFAVHGHFTVSTLFISRSFPLLPTPHFQPPHLPSNSPPLRVVCPYLRGSFRSSPSAASTPKKSKSSSNHTPPSTNLNQLPPGVLDLLHSAATCAQMLVDGRCGSIVDLQSVTSTHASLQPVSTRNWNELFQ